MASCEGRAAGRGGVQHALRFGMCTDASGLSMNLPASLIATWQPRKQQTFPADTAAEPIAFAALQLEVLKRDVLLVVDSEAAVRRLSEALLSKKIVP